MRTGRLAWQTPTGGMLWELWRRQRRLFISQGLLLLVFTVAAEWGGRSPNVKDGALIPLGYQTGVLGLIQVLSCFCYMEVDARRLQGGIPGYLLVRPLTTTRLVAVPMLCGGAAVVIAFLAWFGLVFRHIGFPAEHVWWACAVLVSFTWWVQAVVWSSVNLPWGVQTLFVLLTAGAHLTMGLCLARPEILGSGAKLGLVLVLFGAAYLLGRAGVQRIREGSWEGGAATARPARELPGVGRGRAKFGSAFRAQFWLEWRRQGLKLPLFTGLGLLFLILMGGVFHFISREKSGDAPDMLQLFLNYLVLTPLVVSLVIGDMIARFDASQPGCEMPVFIAIRPMTNGGFVLAKLTMAALSSVVTWLVAVAGVLVWLVVCGQISVAWHVLRAKPAVLAMFLLPSFLTYVLLTWRNLVAGIWLGLTARPAFIAVVNYLRYPAYVGIGALGFRAHDLPEFRVTLVQCLPWILGAFLVAKLLLSVVAFRWGLRRKTVTSGAINCIVGGWLACALFVALMANRLCHDLHTPQALAGAVLAGLCLLPLAELSLAPSALAWNRHR